MTGKRARDLVGSGVMSHWMLTREPNTQLDLGLPPGRAAGPRPVHDRRNVRRLRAVGLFAGIGGFELGLERAGHRARLFCEIDPAAQAVLRHGFPRVEILPDVRRVDALAEAMSSQIDLLTAGFPCQDLSQAGGTVGIDGPQSGLVSHVFRLLEASRVPWVVIENVSFMLRLDRGRAMTRIVTELERLGYRWAYRVVDSGGFGVPQRRERVFLTASLDGDPRGVLLADDARPRPLKAAIGRLAHGFYWTEGTRGLGWAIDSVPTLKGGSTIGIPSPPAILMPDLSVITPDIRDAERLQGLDEDWTAPAAEIAKRGVRWRLVGNAVTVNVAEWLGERLAAPGDYDGDGDETLAPEAPWPAAAWYDGRRRAVSSVSKWPVRRKRDRLHDFLNHDGSPLSARASGGFLSRAAKSTLKFADGFLEAVKSHHARIAV